MQNRHKGLIGKKTCEKRNYSEKNAELFLQTLPFELPTNILKSFTETLNNELNVGVSPKNLCFFSIWKKYKLKVEEGPIIQNIPIEV